MPSKSQPWEAVVDSLQEGLVAVDRTGLIVAMNAAAEHWLGVSQISAVGQSYRTVLTPALWLVHLIDELYSRDQGSIRAVGKIIATSGREISVRASATSTFDNNGERIGAAILLQDQSFQMDLEADLQRARNLTHLSSIVAELAHEIKNPLSGIRGAVQLLQKELVIEKKDEPYTALVLREVDRLTALVAQLLQLGARGELQTTEFNIHEPIEHVLSLLQAQVSKNEISVIRMFDPSLPPVSAHRDSLIQVFLNLIGNAIQSVATLPLERPREICLRSRLETGYHQRKGITSSPANRIRYLRIDVEDTGPGISDENRAHLFSPFFTTKPEGTGLGLAVSHQIVSDHGGTIRFESQNGNTVFRVILPIASGSQL